MEPSRGGEEPASEGRGHCGVGRSRRGGGGVSSNGRGLLVVRLASCVESQLATGARRNPASGEPRLRRLAVLSVRQRETSFQF